MTQDYSIRMATPDDAPAIQPIYAHYVTHSVATFETEAPSAEEVRARIESTLKRYPYLVAVQEGRVVAFAYAGPLRSRPAYDWSAETTIYALEEVHGRGVADSLYAELEELLEQMGIFNLYACIADPNPASERFHEKRGYRKAGAFSNCGFKHGRWLGISWWEKEIGTRMVHPEPVRFGTCS